MDYLIKKISDHRNRHVIQITKEITKQQKKPQIQNNPEEQFTIQQSNDDQELQQDQQKEINYIHSETTKILVSVSGKIEFIYNTPAVQKLRQISESK